MAKPRTRSMPRFELARLVSDASLEGAARLDVAWAGLRVLVLREKRTVRLWSGATRRDPGDARAAPMRDWSDTFPALARAIGALEADPLALDAFVCAMDERGRPSLEALRARAAEGGGGTLLVLFDALHVAGRDLLAEPLEVRLAALAALARDAAPEHVTISRPLEGPPDAVLASVRAMGLPGVIARDAGPYPAELLTTVAAESLATEPNLSPPPCVTNATKVLFPRDGLTKTDVVAYYADVAPVLLPLLADRPVVAQRWPDGIDDFTWYQHRPPPRCPDYVRSVRLEDDRRLLLPTTEALLWMVNQAALTFHGWSSRAARLREPDWAVLDLDPGESTRWSDTIEVALAVRRLLELLGVDSVPKTSGKKGIHVLVPLAPGHAPEQAHAFASGAARLVERLLPALVTTEVEKEKRRGRLYLDFAQNYVGKILVLPYSLRAADGAPVSTPLEWNEVDPKLDPLSFTIRTLRARLDAKGDLAKRLLSGTNRLDAVLAKLAEQFPPKGA